MNQNSTEKTDIESRERFIPDSPDSEFLAQEHISRYSFAAKFVANKQVLDVGCGSGYGSDILASTGAAKVIGVDISEEAISYCQKYYKQSNLKFEQGDCTSLKFKEKSFDVIVAFELIEHIENEQKFLNETKRLLKKNGILILSTPNKETYGLDHPLGGKQKNPFHVKEYTEKELLSTLNKFFTNTTLLYQFYPSTMAILDGKLGKKIEELPVKGSFEKISDTNYFIVLCSNEKIDSYTNFVYLFNHETLPQANYKEFKKWVKSLSEQNKDKESELSSLNSSLKDKESELSSLNSSLKDKESELSSLNSSLKDKESEITQLQSSLESTQQQIMDIHQSFVFRMLHKYDKTLGKVLPLRPKKYLPSSKPQTEYNESPIIEKALTNIPLNKKDIICFPIINWDYRFQRPQHILEKFSEKGHRVFYLTVNLKPIDKNYHIKELSNNIYQIELNSPKYFDIFKDKFNESLISNIITSINEVKKDLKLDVISFVEFPTWANLVIKLKKQLGFKIIFDCLDEYTGFSNVIKEREKEEELLFKKSDFVICSSLHLFEKNQKFASNLLYLPNAGEFSHFNKKPSQILLQNYKKPIIGYFGSIADWFDDELIEYIAKKRPNYTFIFIGHTYGSNIQQLKKLTNIHFLGERPYSELPKYLHAFDACLIPFKNVPLIAATHPVKIYEYMSAGKPVVTTNMNELMPMKELCYISDSKENFLQNIDKALHEKDEDIFQQRIDFASKNTWTHRINTLYSKLNEISSMDLQHHN